MAMSKCASCPNNAVKRESKDPTEVKCAQIFEEVPAYCKETLRVLSSKTQKRQLMETPEICTCGSRTPSTPLGYCQVCYGRRVPPAVGYPIHPPPNQQMTQDQGHSNYQQQSYAHDQPNTQTLPYGAWRFPLPQNQPVVTAPPIQRDIYRRESPPPRRYQEQVEAGCRCCSVCAGVIHSCINDVLCCCIIFYVCDTCMGSE